MITLMFITNINAKRMITKQTSAAAATVLQAAEAAIENPTIENKKNLIMAIQEEAQTPEEQKTIKLRAKRTKLIEQKNLIKKEIKDLNYGLFGFGTSQETQEKYHNAKNRLNIVEEKLAKVYKQLNANKKKIDQGWYNAIDYAIDAAKYLSIPLILFIGYDIYYQKGHLKGFKERYMPERFGGKPKIDEAQLNAQIRRQEELATEHLWLEHQLEQQELEAAKVFKEMKDAKLEAQIQQQQDLETAKLLAQSKNKERLEARKKAQQERSIQEQIARQRNATKRQELLEKSQISTPNQ
jgi:hypothetical protein